MSSPILRPDPVRSKHEPFAAVPHAVAADPRLSPTDVRIYAALLYFLRDRPSCCPTNADLGRRACRSVATVKRSLAKLAALGLIGRVPDANPTGRRLVVHGRATPGSPLSYTRLGDELPPGSPMSHPPAHGCATPKKGGEGEGRNVTDVSLPEEIASLPPAPPLPATTSPRMPQELPSATPTTSGPPAPMRPLKDELKALPGAEAPRVQSLAWRLAHHLKDVASVGFFVMVLGLVANRLAPVERLLAAFRAADRSRGEARKPGAIFASIWTGWQPPPLPSAINRPVYYQAPRPAAPPPPGPGPAEPGPHEVAPPEVAAPRTAPPPSEETIREDRIRQWTIWATTPGHHLRELARRNLAALEAEAPAGEGP
jgi:hypothetical protein